MAGLGVGCAEWVVEAHLRYGGVLPRLRRASEIQGGLGWNPAFADQLRSLGGRTPCRPCDVPWSRPVTGLWWLALPPLTAGGLLAAHRGGTGKRVALATVAALFLAVPYLLMIGYAAPRFLLPAYALLAIPVALCLDRLCAACRARSLARTRPTAVLVSGGSPPPRWARDWRPHPLPDLPGRPGYRAYLAPVPAAGPQRQSSIKSSIT